MKKSSYKFENEEESFQKKYKVEEYFYHWRWFIISTLIFLFLGFLYLRYTSVVYETSTKIKIIDDSRELDIASDPLLALTGNSKLNLENEIEILKSFRLLDQVVESISLDISYFEEGNISTKQIYPSPFEIVKLFPEDSLKTSTYFKVSFETNPATVIDEQGIVQILDSSMTVLNNIKYPVAIRINDLSLVKKSKSKNFKAVLNKKKKTSLDLAKNIKIDMTSKDSEVITLRLQSESAKLSETILNTVVTKFDLDGIKDRQQVSKRTLEFIDERFEYLTEELDSIEGGKQDFKMENNLSYIETDAESSLLRKAETEDEVANLETQISLAAVLKKTVKQQSKYELLPVNIGLENPSLTGSVSSYNQMALERDRLAETVGESHPTLVTLSGQLEQGKLNILKTVNVYQSQLRTALYRLNEQKNKASSIFSSLPEKEKRLRSIERQQSIKENLFLLLLQKREEAAINLAITAPSVKVVDFALTEERPVSPNKAIVLLLSGIAGLFIPFAFIYSKITFNNKINRKEDIEKLNPGVTIIGEIPHLDISDILINNNDRSINTEVFRTLSTSINYLLRKNNTDSKKVIFITSAIKGEGKTQISQNLSLTYASLKKKVLLVGADLRNPQLKGSTKFNTTTNGLTSYLENFTDNWEDCIEQGFTNNPYHNVCYSGIVPENATQLFAGDRFKQFIDNAKQHYDYIIVDTAPTMLVSDTLLIADQADVTIFVTRVDVTKKEYLNFSFDLQHNDKLKNMAYILNDVDLSRNGAFPYEYEYSKESNISNKKGLLTRIKNILK